MEAVPRLPMLSFELKTSPENTEFGPKLKKYISEYYSEDAESYQSEIKELESLRYAAIHVSRDYTGCSTLKKYYSQLHLLQRRFPMTDDGVACVPFMWSDIYSGLVFNITDIKYEQACILYNIGALHSDLGALDSRQTSDGMKISCTHFQCAAWAFQHLRDNFPQPKGSDMSHDLLTFFINVMLGQAQECILEKSMLDNRKSTIIAKVAAQIADYYRQAQKILEMGSKNSETGCIAEIVDSKLFKSWQRYLQFKILYHTCITYMYLGNQAEEQQKMGERLGYFQAALDKLNEAIKLSKQMDKEALADALTFTMDVVGGKFDAAKKENEFIYHEKVLDVATLPEIKGASLVKGIPFHPTDTEVSGPDIFARLVPMETHEASSLYSEEKAKILRRMGAVIEEKNQELELYMASLQLDNLKLNSEPDQLPQELIECCAALSVKPDVIKDLISAMQVLSSIFHDVESSLQEIGSLISEDGAREELLKETIGDRGPSMILNELKKELSKYQEAHVKASESNNTLHKLMNLNLANLKLLILPLEKLQEEIPSVGLLEAPNDEGAVIHLKHLLAKVDEMKNQRQMFENQLREQIQTDDITKQLVAHGEENIQELFDQELKKHQPLTTLLEQNLAAQDNILRALTDANAQYADIRKANNELFQKRNSKIQGLIASFNAYEELITKSQKGQEFYKKLETNVNKLLQRTKGVCKVQEEERQQLLNKNKVKTLKNTTPMAATSGPKLKDYLPYMQNTRTQPQMPTIPPQDALPKTSLPQNYAGISTDAIYLPRPAPVGSEHTDILQCPPTKDYDMTVPYQIDYKTMPTTGYQQIAAATLQPTLPSKASVPTSIPTTLSSIARTHSVIPQNSVPSNIPPQSLPPIAPETQFSYAPSSGVSYQYSPTYQAQMAYNAQYALHNYYQTPTSGYSQSYDQITPGSYGAPIQLPHQPTSIPNVDNHSSRYSMNTRTDAPLQYSLAGVGQAQTLVSSGYNQYSPSTSWANTQAIPTATSATNYPQPQNYYPTPSPVGQVVGSNVGGQPISNEAMSQGVAHGMAVPAATGYTQTGPITSGAMANIQSSMSNAVARGSDRLPSGTDAIQYANQMYSYYEQPQQPGATHLGYYSAPNQSAVAYPSSYTSQPDPKTITGINGAYENCSVAGYAYPQPVASYYNYATPEGMNVVAENNYSAVSNNVYTPYQTPSNVNLAVSSTGTGYPPTYNNNNNNNNNIPAISTTNNVNAQAYPSYQEAPVLIPQKPLIPEKVAPSKPLVPQSPVAKKADTNLKLLEELSSVQSEGDGDLNQKSKEEPVKKADEELKEKPEQAAGDQGRPSGKDPYSDPDTLNRFLADVDRLEKLTEGLTKQLLNGPTLLEQKWKELIDNQDREARKLTISVARCCSMKNRLADVMPYDNNRVQLTAGKDDYINASLLKNLSQSSMQLIATQCPLSSTFADFWLMVYEQQSELIVCLTSDAEIKQNVYWPNEKNQTLTFGSIILGLQTSKNKSWGVERFITLTHHQTRITRVVIHLQCAMWPPRENPGNLRTFLDFVGDAHSFYLQQRSVNRPVIIHCSAGVGRTGVFCLVFSALQDIKFGRGILDVTAVASQMTQMRKFIFQDKDQIRFCYEAVLYHARDLLMKRGILSSKSTFDEKLPSTPKSSHTRHPSQDFILGNLQLSTVTTTTDKDAGSDNSPSEKSVKDDTQSAEKSVKDDTQPAEIEPETQNAPEAERSRSNSVASVASISSFSSTESSNKQRINTLPPSLANLDAANFSLDPLPHKSKRKITKESFLNPVGAGLNEATSDLLDPLSQLDPLWTHKKES